MDGAAGTSEGAAGGGHASMVRCTNGVPNGSPHCSEA